MSNRSTNVDLAMKIVEMQATIIELLSSAVDMLFHTLLQHITVDEACRMAEIEMIREAALLREDVSREKRKLWLGRGDVSDDC